MSEVRTLLTDVVFGESPRWHEGRLWFSDWGAGEVLAVDLDGEREVIVRMPTFPFSLDWLPDGRLLIVSSGLQRMEADGSLVSHGDLTQLAAGVERARGRRSRERLRQPGRLRPDGWCRTDHGNDRSGHPRWVRSPGR